MEDIEVAVEESPGRRSAVSLLFNLRPTIGRELDDLQSTPGYCIFVDLVDSTELKDGGLNVWPMRIFNAFCLIRKNLPEFRPVKSLGDSLMFYIREADLRAKKRSALDLFMAVSFAVQEENKDIFGRTKTAIAYCRDAYEITFIQGTYDIHGKDIDLTARLMSIAVEGEIMMNEAFVNQVRTAYQKSATQNECPNVPKIVGPWPQRFKGFAGYISVYKLPCAATA